MALGSPQPKTRSISRLGVWAAVLGIAGGFTYLVLSGRIAPGKPVCSLCQRPLHQAQVFFATSEKHGERPACCPRCGLRFVIESNGKPLLATDFSNGKRVNAADAVYLEGSDLMQCCATPAVLTESGTVCDVHFDRCMPSLVAFAARTDAETYRRQHGGRLVTLAEATASVARQMGK